MAQATAKWIDAAKTFEGRVSAHIAVADIYDPIEAIKAVVLSAYIGRDHRTSRVREIEHVVARLSTGGLVRGQPAAGNTIELSGVGKV